MAARADLPKAVFVKVSTFCGRFLAVAQEVSGCTSGRVLSVDSSAVR